VHGVHYSVTCMKVTTVGVFQALIFKYGLNCPQAILKVMGTFNGVQPITVVNMNADRPYCAQPLSSSNPSVSPLQRLYFLKAASDFNRTSCGDSTVACMHVSCRGMLSASLAALCCFSSIRAMLRMCTCELGPSVTKPSSCAAHIHTRQGGARGRGMKEGHEGGCMREAA
jgi:hypothetical protein